MFDDDPNVTLGLFATLFLMAVAAAILLGVAWMLLA